MKQRFKTFFVLLALLISTPTFAQERRTTKKEGTQASKTKKEVLTKRDRENRALEKISAHLPKKIPVPAKASSPKSEAVIDVNNNGVGDDVEALIKTKVRSPEGLASQMRVARYYYPLYQEAGDSKKSQVNTKNLFLALNCLDLLKSNKKHAAFVLEKMEPAILNTPERKRKALTAMLSYRGASLTPKTGEALKKECAKLP